jgi:hypothetical protein
MNFSKADKETAAVPLLKFMMLSLASAKMEPEGSRLKGYVW